MKKGPLLGILALLLMGLSWGCWMWFFCRFYVPPNYMAIITAKIGEPLPPDKILASKGQLGVQEDVLGEGRHFLNPIFYTRKIQSRFDYSTRENWDCYLQGRRKSSPGTVFSKS